MKSTANPVLLVTPSADDVCKRTQIYVTPIQRTSSATILGGESWIDKSMGMLFFGEQNHLSMMSSISTE